MTRPSPTALLDRDAFFARAYAAFVRDCARTGAAFGEPCPRMSASAENVMDLRTTEGRLLATYEAHRGLLGAVVVRRVHDDAPRAWPTITVDLTVREVAEIEDVLRMMAEGDLEYVERDGVTITPWSADAVSGARKMLEAIARALPSPSPATPASPVPSPGEAS